MKKTLLAVLVLILALLPVCASAATLLAQHSAVNVVYLGAASNTYVVASADGYQIFAADGTAIGPVWGNMGPYQSGLYYQVLHNGGYSMVTAQGELVLPDNYFGFVSPGTGWMLGVVMAETTDAVADYTSKSGTKMNVLRTDVVYDGKMIGSLTREQYVASASTGLLGDYLYVLHADGRCIFFDTALNMTAQITTAQAPAEYTQADGVYIHTPTQQPAFTAGCTLTADQVDQAAMLIGNQLLDLQGNVLLTLPEEGLYAAQLRGSHVHAEYLSGLSWYRGLWNLAGQQIIPAEYAYVGDSYSTSASFFPGGYQPVLNWDGDLFFYDQSGAITASVTGMNLSYRNLNGFLKSAPILVVGDKLGYSLISATHGLLPGQYEDYYIYSSGAQLIAVCRGGQWGCVDMTGNTVVPFELADSPSISNDGTLLVGEKPDGTWGVYQIGY